MIMTSNRTQSELQSSDDSSYTTDNQSARTFSVGCNQKIIKQKKKVRLSKWQMVMDRTFLSTPQTKHLHVFVKIGGFISFDYCIIISAVCNSTIHFVCGAWECDSHVGTNKTWDKSVCQKRVKYLFSDGVRSKHSHSKSISLLSLKG